MKKFGSIVFHLYLWFKTNLSFKRIVKQKILGIIFIVYLVGTIFLGTIAFWKVFTSPAIKIYPQITFAEFLQQIKAGQIEYLYLEHLSDDVRVQEFTTGSVIILMKSKTGDVFITPKIDLTKFTYTEFTSRIKNSQVEGTTVILDVYRYSVSETFIFGWLKDKNFFITTFPTKSTPLGILAPCLMNLSGYFIKSRTSIISSLASSMPATSLKVIFSFIAKASFRDLISLFLDLELAIVTKQTKTKRFIINQTNVPHLALQLLSPMNWLFSSQY